MIFGCRVGHNHERVESRIYGFVFVLGRRRRCECLMERFKNKIHVFVFIFGRERRGTGRATLLQIALIAELLSNHCKQKQTT